MNHFQYSDFVCSRIKWMPTQAEDLHHAATGIMGEVAELVFADNRENVLEELGDITFYMEHFNLAMKTPNGLPLTIRTLEPNLGLEGCLMTMIKVAGELLDQTKKGWIYGKPTEQLDLAGPYLELGWNLMRLYAFWGTDEAEVSAANVAKLRNRYPSGYTDAASQARADKAGET